MRIPPLHLAKMVVEQAILHPETHNQENWECGTQRCLAGWGLHFAGIKITSGGEVLAKDCPDWLLKELSDKIFQDFAWRPAIRIIDVAGKLFGLTPTQARDIFYETSEFEAVEALRAAHGI